MTDRRGWQFSSSGAPLLAGAVVVTCSLPLFLVGAMAVQIADELSLSAAALGLAIGVSRGSGATASATLGRFTDRFGAVWSLRVALLIAVVASCGICFTVRGAWSLIGWLFVAGWANALGQPAVNRLIARVVSPSRLGLAFGVKQSAPPAALMIAGLCVPTLALTVGWRWSFALVAVFAMVMALLVGRRPADATSREPRPPSPRLRLSDTWVFLVAFALGAAVSSAGTAFYVTWAVASGTEPATAGLVLGGASLAAVMVRLVSGWASDRMPAGHLRLCAVMLLAGCTGFGFLATGDPVLGAAGITVALAGTWGFNGVFWFALVRAYPATPGAITGAIAPGGLVGAALGPFGFGLLVGWAGYDSAWAGTLGVSVLAAFAMLAGARRLPEPFARA